MTLRETLKTLETAFLIHWHNTQASLLARTLLAELLERSEASILAHDVDMTPSKVTVRLPELVRRIRSGEPVAYLVGWKTFFHHRFRVNTHVLIPRKETEQLVQLALRAPTSATFIDIGTGSGCIAISLQLARPNASVLATDVSLRALDVARTNAKTLLPTPTIRFIHASLLAPSVRLAIKRLHPPSLTITANLPYLPQSDKRDLHVSVTKHEPDLALYANDHGNALIKTLLRQLKRLTHELPNTPIRLLAELDHPQAKALVHFAEKLFHDSASCVILNDENALPRFLSITLK